VGSQEEAGIRTPEREEAAQRRGRERRRHPVHGPATPEAPGAEEVRPPRQVLHRRASALGSRPLPPVGAELERGASALGSHPPPPVGAELERGASMRSRRGVPRVWAADRSWISE